jgi:hypothetical protein
MAENIEIENNEIIARNSYGDLIIVPAKHKKEFLDMVTEKCFSCIDEYAKGLPKMEDYK